MKESAFSCPLFFIAPDLNFPFTIVIIILFLFLILFHHIVMDDMKACNL